MSPDAVYLLETYFRVSTIAYVTETKKDNTWYLLVVIEHHDGQSGFIYTLFCYTGPDEPQPYEYNQVQQLVAPQLVYLRDNYHNDVVGFLDDLKGKIN